MNQVINQNFNTQLMQLLEADDDEGIWDISQDRFKKLTL